MGVDAVAASATALKAAQMQSQVSTAVEKMGIELQKDDAALILKMMTQSMGIGRNVDVFA